MSITEQYTDWIDDIYGEPMSMDEMPYADSLFNYFSMPYGQALYVAWVLNNKSHLLAQAIPRTFEVKAGGEIGGYW